MVSVSISDFIYLGPLCVFLDESNKALSILFIFQRTSSWIYWFFKIIFYYCFIYFCSDLNYFLLSTHFGLFCCSFSSSFKCFNSFWILDYYLSSPLAFNSGCMLLTVDLFQNSRCFWVLSSLNLTQTGLHNKKTYLTWQVLSQVNSPQGPRMAAYHK